VLLCYAIYFLYQQMRPPAPEPSSPVTAIGAAPAPSVTPTSVCASPCCGGTSCLADPENKKKLTDLCSDSAARCGECPSGRKCVPGSCGSKLPADQGYALRLAHAIVNGREPSPE